jgi:hypothetical protein
MTMLILHNKLVLGIIQVTIKGVIKIGLRTLIIKNILVPLTQNYSLGGKRITKKRLKNFKMN